MSVNDPGLVAELRSRLGRKPRLLLLFPAGCLAFLIAEFAYLGVVNLDPTSSPADVGSGVLFSTMILLWNAVAVVALAGLILIGAAVFSRGLPVVVLTCVSFTAALAGLVLEMNVDDSSTAVLLLLFLPIYLSVPLIPCLGLTALVHWLRCRRAAAKESTRR